MRRNLTLLIAFLMFVATASLAQQQKRQQGLSNTYHSHHPASTVTLPNDGCSITAVAMQENDLPATHLSPMVSVSGGVFTGISGNWYTQTNGRGLHNIQVDPSDPNKIHALVMTAQNVNINTDTTTANFFPSRNVFYTYSSDGGATWKTPVKINNTRSGYEDMILYNRGGVYVPIIAFHRFTSASVTDLFCTVAVETGAPGAGNFKTANTTRATFNNATKDIIWPSIATNGSTIYIVAAVSTTTTADYLQFGTFDLAADGTPSNFSGWLSGPGTTSNAGLSTGGDYVIRLSPKGTLGLFWHNYDLATPDFGLYYSESTDKGVNWSDPTNVFASVQADFSDPNPNFVGDPTDYLRSGGGLDMFFDGEGPVCVFDGYYGTNNFNVGQTNSYIPSSGTLMYWRKSMTTPVVLISQLPHHQTTLPEPLDTGDYLSKNPASSNVVPQTPTIQYPTIARTESPKAWSIVFEAWTQGDSSNAVTTHNYDFTTDTMIYLPFHSIYKTTTSDNGNTWVASPVIQNDMSQPISKHLDFRFPGVSSWNPIKNGKMENNVIFAVDTAAGNWFNPGDPGFDPLSFYYYNDKQAVNSVRINTDGLVSVVDLGQNYPNPVVTSTTIPVVLPIGQNTTVTLEDVLGRTVKTIYAGYLSAGEHDLMLQASSLMAGVYRYTVTVGGESVSHLMTVVR